MTALRQRMTEDMQLRSLSPRTQESYLRSVSKLAEHYHRSPDKISEEELRQYFLYMKNVKKSNKKIQVTSTRLSPTIRYISIHSF